MTPPHDDPSSPNWNRRQVARGLAGLAALAAGGGSLNDVEASLIVEGQATRVDRQGDPLPPRALSRVGTVRFWDDAGIWSRGTIAFGPDGLLIVTGGMDPPVTLWDPKTGQIVRRLGKKLPQVPDSGQRLHGMAFSSDGATLAVARRGGSIERWEVATGRLLEPWVGHTDSISSIAFSSDGSTMASCGMDGLIFIRDARTGQVRHRLTLFETGFRPDSQEPEYLKGVALSEDGGLVVACGKFTKATLWETKTGRLIRTFKGPFPHEGMFGHDSVAISPDGQTVAAGGCFTIGIWDRTTGQLRFRFEETHDQDFKDDDSQSLGKFAGDILALAFSPDGRTLASACHGGAVRLWDPIGGGVPLRSEEILGTTITKGTQLARLDWHEGVPRTLAFGPDGRSLAAAGECGVLRLWDLPDQRDRFRTTGPRSSVTSLAFTPDGQTLVALDGDAVCVVDPTTGETSQRRYLLPEICSQSTLAPDGLSLAYQGLGSEPWINVVAVATGDLICRIDQPHPEGSIATLEFAADGKTLIVSEAGPEDEYAVTLFDRQTGAKIQSFTAAEEKYFDHFLLLPAQKTMLLVTPYPDTLYLNDLATGEVRDRLVLGRNDVGQWLKFTAVAVSADGSLLVTTEEARAVRLWDVTRAREIRNFAGRLPRCHGPLAFAPNGSVVAVGSWSESREPLIQLWDAASGRELPPLSGHRGPITALAFSPDSRRLASGSADTTVLVWDLPAGPR